MAAGSDGPQRPDLGRTITLTDAVVAIAMTVLVLPLIDIIDALGPVDAIQIWHSDAQAFISFAVSFFVIWTFWSAHATLFRRLQAAGLKEVRGLSQLHACWLLIVTFLPFSTALIGRGITTGSAPIYLGTVFLLSLFAYAMTVVAKRALHESSTLDWLTPVIICLCALVSFRYPVAGIFLLFLLLVTAWIENRAYRRD